VRDCGEAFQREAQWFSELTDYMMSTIRGLKSVARVCLDGASWKPSHASVLLRDVAGRKVNERAGYTDNQHLREAAHWIARAQDASGDGGIMGRYGLGTGWTSSYPETTGYSIPTLLNLGSVTGNNEWIERAYRAVDFLLRVQLPEGGFPGGEIGENRTDPSIFNTAQIICGLTAWYRRTSDEKALTAALRAGTWMAAAQEADGSWRRWIYGTAPYTYMAYAAGWLAELGSLAGDPSLLHAGARHLEWVMSERDLTTGWFRHSGFPNHGADYAVTHTIAYTLAGVLQLSRLTAHSEGVKAVEHAALQIARTLELRRELPAVLDRDWRGRASYTCLTGNAQMALIWLDLHRESYDPALLSAAFKAIDLVKRAQPMTSANPGVRGGIPGSDPLWGEYISLAYPNWAAKYFVDALLAKREALAEFRIPKQPLDATPPVPIWPPPIPEPGNVSEPQFALLAGPWEEKALRIAQLCERQGVRPRAIVVEQQRTTAWWLRLSRRIRDHGLAATWDVFRRGINATRTATPAIAERVSARESLLDYCRKRGIPYLRVERLASPQGSAALRGLELDVAIHAGAGILREPTLEIPRLGVLNAHMGILPSFRGMNVAEWSALMGARVGCTVHLIDGGIDTGDILCCRFVSTDRAGTIQELRDAVDEEQLRLLGEVIGYIHSTGTLPPRVPQEPAEGRQYFRMHAELAAQLERWLANGQRPAAEREESSAIPVHA
jgi:folate-dependent phosphoribosylglycinamide formyltransferase PurN